MQRVRRTQSNYEGNKYSTTVGISEYNGMKERAEQFSQERINTTIDIVNRRQHTNQKPRSLDGLKKTQIDKDFDNFQKKELQRRVVDEEEKNYIDGVRAKQINAANISIFRNHKNVRGMLRGMLYSDTLQEREGQILQQKQMKQMMSQYIDYHDQIQQEKWLESDQQGEQLKQNLILQKHQCQVVINQQQQIVKERYKMNLSENIIDGQLIRMRAQEESDEKKEQKLNGRMKMIKNSQDMIKANDELLAMKEKEKQLQVEQELKVQQFLKRKDEIQVMKEKRLDLITHEQNNRRQFLFDAQVVKQNEQQRARNSILHKNAIERELNEAKEGQIKEEKFQRLQQNCIIFNNKQERKIKQSESAQDVANWKWQIDLLGQQEETAERQRRMRERDVVSFQSGQVRDREIRKERAISQDIEDLEQIKLQKEIFTVNLDQWTKQKIEDCIRGGKNPHILIREARKRQII